MVGGRRPISGRDGRQPFDPERSAGSERRDLGPAARSSRGVVRYVCMSGTGFSGTTLLSFLLNAHPDCASIGEATGLIDDVVVETYACSCGEPFLRCGFWKRVQERVRELGATTELYGHRWNTRFSVSSSHLLDVLLVRSLRSGFANRVRDRVVRWVPFVRRRLDEAGGASWAFARAALDVTGKSVFVDSAKDPQRAKMLSRVPDVDVRVIHVTRDVRANAASIMKREARAGAAGAARIWKRAHLEAQRVSRGLPADCWLRVTYGDLCRDPQGTMDRIADFLGVRRAPIPPDFRSVEHHIIGNPMRLSSTGEVREDLSWRERLSASDLAVIERIAGPLNRELGFDWPPER
jgi:hypothetical protein